MKASFLSAVAALTLAAAIPSIAQTQENHDHGHDNAVAHTHIGVNPTWRPADWARPEEGFDDSDPTDDNKLWVFSMPPTHQAATPGWPNWEHANDGVVDIEDLRIVVENWARSGVYSGENAEGHEDE